MTVDDYFTDRDPADREVFEAVAAHLQELGQVEYEAVGVGILFKHGPTFVELRPRRVGMSLSMVLPRRLDHPRVSRRIPMTGSRASNTVPVRSAADIDEQVRRWLTEAYVLTTEGRI
jgi:hypothetical protein